MIASNEETLKVFRLLQEKAGYSVPRLQKATGFSHKTVKDALRNIREAEQQFFKAQERSEKYERLISYSRPIRDIERGKTKGAKGVGADDKSPSPSGMRLYPFLCILTEKPSFTSNTLPIGQQIEGSTLERGR